MKDTSQIQKVILKTKLKLKEKFDKPNEVNESATSGSAEILLTVSNHAFLLQQDK